MADRLRPAELDAANRDNAQGRLDDEALQGLRRGDNAAFRRVYTATVGLVAYVATRCGLVREEVDEVVQETYLRLHARANDIRDAASIKAWLAATARNLAFDRQRLRTRQATDAVGDGLETVPAREDLGPSAMRRELEIELVRDLLERVASTPGGETLRLFYVDGMSAKDIATRNGEAISTVTTRLSRLRLKFKDELAQHIEALRARLP